MGKHYIPRYYLKSFLNKERKSIIVYKTDGTHFELNSLDNIAQEKEMYSDETELFLTNQIEQPANSILDKLRAKAYLDEEEKLTFSTYMFNIYSRTPDSLEEYKDSAPEYLDELEKKEISNLEQLMRNSGADLNLLIKRKDQLKEVIQDLKKNPPKEAWENSLNPSHSNKSANVMSKMNWVLFYEDVDCFVTCDRPVFHFKEIGLVNKKSEFSFPLSPRLTLWGTWRTDIDNYLVKANNSIIKNFNNRTLSRVYRHAFFSKRRDWIPKIINKKNYSFSQLL